jgi:multidrug efflux pump
MSLSSISLKRPVLAIVVSIIIVLFGVISFNFLGVREYPSIDPPVITVRTSYTGANADIIESQITEPLEKSINGIAGIKSISSSSNQGTSSITVEFELGVDLEAAANDVRDKVSQAVRQLPLDIDGPPVVSKADANSDAIISMLVQSDTRNHLELSDYATNVIMEQLQTIPGVSTIQVWGEKKYSMRLWMDPVKLSSFKLTPVDVLTALINQNVELPSGKIAGNSTEVTVKTMGRLSSPDEFNNLIIASQNGRIIRFKNIGNAEYGPENEETVLRESGVPMIGLALVPQPGSNYIAIADEFYKRYDRIKKEVPSDIQLSIGLDQTKFVKNSIKEVEETLLIAIGLVVLIVYLFFRDFLISIRPLIDIPVSLIGAFFIMYICGFSINILTLLAIVLATGLVVDDGIVVTENIYKKMEEGMDKAEAAKKGSEEIYFAVISTSITLAIVFLPIIFLQGFVGRLFREFGVVVAGAVLISAFVSLTLTPVLNVKLSKKDPHKRSRFYKATEPFFVNLINGYRKSLTNFMKRRWMAFIILVISVGIAAIIFMQIPKELAPTEDRSEFRMRLSAPEGASFEYMDHYIMDVVKLIQDSVPEKKVLISVTAPGFSGSGAPNTGMIRVMLTDPRKRDKTQSEIIELLNRNLKWHTMGRANITPTPTISSGGLRSGQPIQFVIQNNNFEKIRKFLPLFMNRVQQDPTFQGVDVDLKFNKPEMDVSIDRDRAEELGVSISDIATTLQLAYSGRRFSYFTKNGKQYQVIGQFNRANRDDETDLTSLYVRNKFGELVQLDNVLTTTPTSSPPQLYHYNRYRSATVSSNLAPGKTIGDGIEVMKKIQEEVLDSTFTTALTGQSRDFSESSSNILFAFIFALVLIYLVLAAQFESFIDPFIVMLTIPMAFAGAFISLWYFDQTWNIFSQIGVIMLIGLVTKNGILIVEFANQLKKTGMSKYDAIIEAATMRLRPILMTSLATALGALPIAMSFGAASQSRMPLGIVIVGGICFSLILTLFVIPAMYTFLSKNISKKTQTIIDEK